MELPLESESAQRRARTFNRLKSEGVTPPRNAPDALTTKDLERRKPADVADRVLCLVAVATKASGGSTEDVSALIEHFKLAKKLTAAERAYLDSVEADPQLAIEMTWRWESAAALLWTLGHLSDLGRPDHECEVALISRTIEKLGREGLAKQGKSPLTVEILDEFDAQLCYCAVATSAINAGKRPPTKLNAGVIDERRLALEWVLTDCEWE